MNIQTWQIEVVCFCLGFIASSLCPRSILTENSELMCNSESDNLTIERWLHFRFLETCVRVVTCTFWLIDSSQHNSILSSGNYCYNCDGLRSSFTCTMCARNPTSYLWVSIAHPRNYIDQNCVLKLKWKGNTEWSPWSWIGSCDNFATTLVVRDLTYKFFFFSLSPGSTQSIP